MRFSPTWAEKATTGVLLVVASAVPRRRLMAPGPRVAEHTPACPVMRPKISAMNDAACSWRTNTYRMEERARASVK
jgi:hypothetical protein